MGAPFFQPLCLSGASPEPVCSKYIGGDLMYPRIASSDIYSALPLPLSDDWAEVPRKGEKVVGGPQPFLCVWP